MIKSEMKKTILAPLIATGFLLKFFTFILIGLTVSYLGARPALADVAYDASSESHPTDGTYSSSGTSFTFSHTPSGTPKGVVVYVISIATTANETSVTYGSSSMTAVTGGVASDTATEVATVKAWYLGSSVPTGTQTITINRTDNSVLMIAFAMTVTATYNTEVYEAGIQLLQENQSITELNVDDGSPGTNSLRVGGCYTGTASPPTAGANSTLSNDNDMGAYGAATVYETTPGQGSRPVGCVAGNDDRATVYFAIREIQPTYTFSGTIRTSSNESTAFDCSSSGPYTINLRVNGSGTYTYNCSLNTGYWEATGVTVSAGQTIYAYISGESVKGTTVLVASAANTSNIDIIVDRVSLRDDVNGSITNTEILAGNLSDSDDLITTSGTDVTVSSSYETHIYTGDTYAPGTNVSTGKLHVVGNYTGSSETLTISSSGTSTSRPLYVDGGTFTANTNTVKFTGGSSTDVEAASYNKLTIDGTGPFAMAGNLSVGSDLTITSGTLTVGSTYTTAVTGNTSITGGLTISSTGNQTFTGTTTINSSGTFTRSSATGTNVFVGLLTISGSGTFTTSNNPAFTLRGGLANSGTFTSGTGTYTFDTNSQSISGSAATSFGGTVAITGAITIQNSNTNTVTITGDLTGSAAGSTWQNNANATTEFKGAVLATGTLTATASPNTINYTGSTAQTVKMTTYHHLNIKPSANSVTSLFGAGTLTVNGDLVLGNGTNTGVIIEAITNDPNIAVTGSLTVSGNTTFNNANTGSPTESIGGQLIIVGTYTGNSVALTLSGSGAGASRPLYINGGTFTAPTTTNFTGTAATDIQNATYNAVNFLPASGTPTYTLMAGTFAAGATVVGNASYNVSLTGATNNPTISMAGFSLGGGSTFTASSSVTDTGDWTVATGGTFAPNNGTVTFSGGNAQNINGTAASQTFYNVIIDKSANGVTVNGSTTQITFQDFTQTLGNFTAPATTNINGNILLTAGVYTAGANTNVTGNWTNNGATFTHSSGIVTFNSTTAGQTLGGTSAGQSFYTIVVDKSGRILTLGNTITVGNNLTISAGTLTDAGYQITGNGTGTLSMAASTFLYLGSAGTATAFPTSYTNGNISLDTASTVVYQAGTTQAISHIPTYGNLSILPTITGNVTDTFSGAANINGNLTINATSTGANTLTVNLGGTTTVASGKTTSVAGTNAGLATLDTVSGSNYSLSTGLINIDTGGTFIPRGSTVTITGTSASPLFTRVGTFDVSQGTSTVLFSQTSADTTLTSGIITFDNLQINMSGRTGNFGNNITVNDTTTVTAGTLSTSSSNYTLNAKDIVISSGAYLKGNNSTINVSGNWTNSGTFTYDTSTVNFNGGGAATNQTLGGTTATTTFYAVAFTHADTSAARTIYFADGKHYAVATGGQITMTGNSTRQLLLTSTGGTAWYLDVDAGATINTVSYTTPSWSDANGGQEITALTTSGNVDGGNNPNWIFDGEPEPTSTPTPTPTITPTPVPGSAEPLINFEGVNLEGVNIQ